MHVRRGYQGGSEGGSVGGCIHWWAASDIIGPWHLLPPLAPLAFCRCCWLQHVLETETARKSWTKNKRGAIRWANQSETLFSFSQIQFNLCSSRVVAGCNFCCCCNRCNQAKVEAKAIDISCCCCSCCCCCCRCCSGVKGNRATRHVAACYCLIAAKIKLAEPAATATTQQPNSSNIRGRLQW